MKLEQNKFHKSFKLNGTSFGSVDEILEFSKSFSDEIYQFLENWFANKNYILVQTSGSTGKPKTIQLKKELMQNSAIATCKYFNLPQKTTALLCLPIAYIAGKMMLVRALTLGWHLDVVEPSTHPLKKINTVYDFSAMVPLQLENSLSKIHIIKKIIVGGGVVSNILQQQLAFISTKVFATYGMTETITHIAVKQLNNFVGHKNSANLKSFYSVLPNVSIYKDQRNCLVIEAPKVAEEIIFTNDVVALVSDTQFSWLGRLDNVINSGAVKLHPEKIEEKLSKIIKKRFFVTGMADDSLGEKLVLIIEDSVTNKEKEQLFNSIKNLETLLKFEKPKEIYFIKKFIETASGKVQRSQTLLKIKLK